jgi:YhcN/YlaJ family sporulation lipoprotein
LKTAKPMLLMFITLLIGICLITGGCSSKANKSPNPTSSTKTPETANTIPNTQTTPVVTSTEQITPKEVANQAVTEADKVLGVKGATAFVSGQNVYIGLNLQANIDKQKSAAIGKSVVEVVKSMEPGYTIMATSDLNTVAAIKTVSQGVSQGKSLSSFNKEIDNISVILSPKGK